MGFQIKRLALLIPSLFLFAACSNTPTNTRPVASTNPPSTPPAPTTTPAPQLPTGTPPPTITTTATDVPLTPTTVPLLPEEINALTGLMVCNSQGRIFVVAEGGNLVDETATLKDAFLFHFDDNSYFIQDGDVWVSSSSGAESQPLMQTEDVEEEAIYGRLGEWLLVRAAPLGEQDRHQSFGPLFLLRLDGSEYKLLIDETIIDRPLLSEDGTLAIISTQGDVFLIDENEVQSSPFEQHFSFGAIASNNQYVAHNGSNIGVSAIPGGELVAEFAHQGALSVGDISPEPFQWSPDSEWVAVETFDLQVEPPAVPNQIFVFNISTGEAQTIANAWNPRWSPDGEILVFATNPRSPQIQLLRFTRPTWEVVETGYEGLPVRWSSQTTVPGNSQQPFPVECAGQ